MVNSLRHETSGNGEEEQRNSCNGSCKTRADAGASEEASEQGTDGEEERNEVQDPSESPEVVVVGAVSLLVQNFPNKR